MQINTQIGTSVSIYDESSAGFRIKYHTQSVGHIGHIALKNEKYEKNEICKLTCKSSPCLCPRLGSRSKPKTRLQSVWLPQNAKGPLALKKESKYAN